MKKFNFNRKRVIIFGSALVCMSIFFLRNSAFSSPFEYVNINGEEQCIEHNAKVDKDTYSPKNYVNNLRANGGTWSVSDSLAVVNAGPSCTIVSWVCVYKNNYNATCNKSKEGIWVVTGNGVYTHKLN